MRIPKKTLEKRTRNRDEEEINGGDLGTFIFELLATIATIISISHTLIQLNTSTIIMMQTILLVSSLVAANAFVSTRAPVRSSRVTVNMADIVDTAVSAGSFKTLAAALTAAGLVPALKGAGPFTVFAPTDEAFAKLP